MNRSYRTVWNEALGAWVAISEISSARGKKSSSKVTVVSAAVGVLVALSAGLPFDALATATWGPSAANGGNIAIAGVGGSVTTYQPALLHNSSTQLR